MPAPYIPVGSLEELVTRQVTEFIQNGLDTPAKLSLIETASQHSFAPRTPAEYAHSLGYTFTPETIQAELEHLVAIGLFLRQDCASLEEAKYRLTEDQEKRSSLRRMLEMLSDPSFRALAVAQLRYASP